MARRRSKKKVAVAYVPPVDATPERLAKGDDSEWVNAAEIDDTEQAINRVRRFRSSTLDRLHNNGKISWPQWYAGDQYRNAYHRAAMLPGVVASYGERTTVGECSYGLARTESQVRARQFVRQCREQIPFDMRGFMDRLLIHDDLPRYGGRKAMRSLAEVRRTLDSLADFMRIAS
ncbi:hypothetical protein K7W03_14380 [Sphingobium sp. PNB]|uniref:hypothetical protein n=1 Tax=Sphingobium sp. PNB TaxID=863934 RepID=UPI001CA3CB91|nr:hypothetical protein [Sphingobium sp. PNB]MCB4860778.1 hypothetical protein [Sphingobium sp. PNB]